jgi:hypothetical protein
MDPAEHERGRGPLQPRRRDLQHHVCLRGKEILKLIDNLGGGAVRQNVRVVTNYVGD